MSLKERTISLRKTGLSYNEINKILNVPKSTLSGWLKNINLSKKAKSRLTNRVRMGLFNGLIKRNIAQTAIAQKRVTKIRIESSKEIGKFSERDLFVAGIVLYWAEGYKRVIIRDGRERTCHPISLTNSDPFVINSFIFFLLKIMKIPKDKIRMELRLFPTMNAQKMIGHWSRVTKIPASQFDKPMFVISKSSQGIRPFNRLPHGIAQVRVLNTNEFYRLLGWIEGVKKSLDILIKKR